MRFLCACVVEHEGTFQKKVEMIEVKEKDFAIASSKVAELISTKYNIPNKFVEREPEQVGILYINPKKVIKAIVMMRVRIRMNKMMKVIVKVLVS